jgi:hypothetical protein
MDFLLKNKIYLLPLVVVAFIFGYFFYNASVMGLFADDYIYYRSIYGITSSRPHLVLAYVILPLDFHGILGERFFYTAIFMSITFVVFLYIISFYVNFRFLWTKKDKIGQDTLIYVIVFILFMATNNSLGNIFWFSAFVCHIVGELLCLLFFIHYLPFLEKDNFEKIANRNFLTKFLWIAYLYIFALVLGVATQTTSLFAIFTLMMLFAFLIKKYGKKYFIIYFFYFAIPLIILACGFVAQSLYRTQYVDIYQKLHELLYFYKFWIHYIYYGYKYFIPFIVIYLVILGLYLFKKININNKKIFNRSALMFFAFFINMNILIYMLYNPQMIRYVPLYNEAKYLERWFTMSDVFLALFVIQFFWFLIQEYKNKLNKNIYWISLFVINLLIGVSFTINIIETNNHKKFWKKSLKEVDALINKINYEIEKNDCFVLDNLNAATLVKHGFTSYFINNKNYYDYFMVEDKENTWILYFMLDTVKHYSIDIKKIKFRPSDVCEIKKVDNKGENTIKKNSK